MMKNTSNDQNQMLFAVELMADPDGGVIVTAPDIPELITHGLDRADALVQAREALGLCLRHRLANGEPLPASASSGSGCAIAPLASDAAKLLVIDAFQNSGMTKTQLADALGKTENVARRILDPHHYTKLDTLDSAMQAMGRQFVFGWKAAA